MVWVAIHTYIIAILPAFAFCTEVTCNFFFELQFMLAARNRAQLLTPGMATKHSLAVITSLPKWCMIQFFSQHG